MKNRYTGTLRFKYGDGYVEETVFREHASKGVDNFMSKVIDALVANIVNFTDKFTKEGVLATYEGDCEEMVRSFLKFLTKLDAQTDLEEIKKTLKLEPERINELEKVLEGLKVK